MGLEIERKFLVTNNDFRQMANNIFTICQGYLCKDPERIVRIRTKGERGFITIKGITEGVTRLEFEYEIPIEEAKCMLRMCIPPLIEKMRYIISFEGKIWEIDEFSGELAGLKVAEIELSSENEEFKCPDFIGEEVTGNPAYYNSNL